MTRQEFMRSSVTYVYHDGSEVTMTRAELVAEALRVNNEEYNRLFEKFLKKSREITDEKWEEMKKSPAWKVFKHKTENKKDFIDSMRPDPIKYLDQVEWYSKDALAMYSEAMNYDI